MDHPENYYTSKTQPKMKFGKPQVDKNGKIKQRHLVPPTPSLKLIQRQVCEQLQTIELPGCMYGSVKESNNILNALQHIDNKFFLTIDLKNFFTNITNTQVHQVLMEINLTWEEARMLTKLTTFKGSLPQGSPSSPILANLAFAKTTLQLQEFMKKHKITFTIFPDDLTFSSKKDFKFLLPDILNIIRENRFYPHHKKIHYRRNCCEVTGLIVGSGKLRLTNETKIEALKNPRVKGYTAAAKKEYKEYLEGKRTSLK
jgi:RNA-directed DNA polymerase